MRYFSYYLIISNKGYEVSKLRNKQSIKQNDKQVEKIFETETARDNSCRKGTGRNMKSHKEHQEMKSIGA